MLKREREPTQDDLQEEQQEQAQAAAAFEQADGDAAAAGPAADGAASADRESSLNGAAAAAADAAAEGADADAGQARKKQRLTEGGEAAVTSAPSLAPAAPAAGANGASSAPVAAAGSAADLVELRCSVPSAHTGALIGKGGSNIASVRASSAASVMVLANELAPRSADRVLQIRGPLAAVSSAVQLVLDLLHREVVQRQESGTAARSTLALLVHHAQLPALVGEDGQSLLLETENLTGARVHVGAERLGRSSEKRVEVSGSAAQVHAAVDRFLHQMVEAPLPSGTTTVHFVPGLPEGVANGGPAARAPFHAAPVRPVRHAPHPQQQQPLLGYAPQQYPPQNAQAPPRPFAGFAPPATTQPASQPIANAYAPPQQQPSPYYQHPPQQPYAAYAPAAYAQPPPPPPQAGVPPPPAAEPPQHSPYAPNPYASPPPPAQPGHEQAYAGYMQQPQAGMYPYGAPAPPAGGYGYPAGSFGGAYGYGGGMPRPPRGDRLSDPTQSTQRLAIPTACSGAVLGHRGDIVRDMAKRSGAKISLAPADPTNPTERVVSVIGNPQQIEAAIALISAAVESFTPGSRPPPSAGY